MHDKKGNSPGFIIKNTQSEIDKLNELFSRTSVYMLQALSPDPRSKEKSSEIPFMSLSESTLASANSTPNNLSPSQTQTIANNPPTTTSRSIFTNTYSTSANGNAKG